MKPNVPGDLEILKAIGRHGLLLPTDICAITKRSYDAIIYRTKKLKNAGLLRWPEAQDNNRRSWFTHPKALQLTKKGVSKLQEIGFEPITPEPSTHFVHYLTECQVMVSFEIGARERFIPFAEILQSPSTPEAIKNTGDHSFPVSFKHKGRQWDYDLTPDARPFAIEYPNDFRFFALEVDLQTENLRWSDKNRQTIERKFIAYINVLQNKTYERFGFRNLTVLFTTSSAVRVTGMMDLLASVADTYRNRFAFAHFPPITGDTPQPVDKGWAFNQPWSRCGGVLNIGEE
ncbi:hypothetical protein ACVWZV_002242 [Bradyrhizobium sp. GM5.1]